ncbi:transmembrane protein 182-like [Dunckerocampus dactyliophorus]|uniref:transmembrane protein 182-like n=1 Tax=Dunckerocampus dactyliophorus TaxID=161453 RepID=UPI00240530A4|nr:transmembrane protein 182-like [Dunckerocampus dactyliophorus]
MLPGQEHGGVPERRPLTGNASLSLLLFFALFTGTVGVLSTLFSCATDYWLLGAAELCDPGRGPRDAQDVVRIFHEGLFWRCSLPALSPKYSLWDVWIFKPPHVKVCHAAFLFPFPAKLPFWAEPGDSPAEPYEHHSAIVFRTFWSVFLIVGVVSVVAGGLTVVCAAPLTKDKLYKVGGALLLCGGVCLLAMVLMYLTWVQVLDTLEEFALRQRVGGCPTFHLSVQHGPSFLLAPVASFFCLLSGLLFLVLARSTRSLVLDPKDKRPEPAELETDL